MERDYYLEAIQSTCYMPMQALRGGGGMMLHIFNLSTRKGRVVNTKTQPLYPTAEELQYPFYRRLGGPPQAVWRGLIDLFAIGFENLQSRCT